MHRIFHKFLFSLAFTAWTAAGLAQGQLLSVEYFGEDKGLNIITLNDIFQDRVGFLWLATWEGLVRFDGHNFKHFRKVQGDSTSIFCNNVLSIAEDKDGDIWAGLARGGVSRYDRKTGKFRNYKFTDKLKLKTSSVTRVFFDKKGEIWLGVSSYGIVHLDKKTGGFKTFDIVTAQNAPYLTPEELANYNVAYNFWQDEKGKIWCTTSADIYEFDPDTGQAVSHRADDVESGGLNYLQAYSIHPDGDLLWVGGWTSGLRSYNRRTGEWKKYPFVQKPAFSDAFNIVNAIAPKNADELWLTSADQGLVIFNKTTEKFTFLAHDTENYPDVPTTAVGYLYKDRQGNIWINHANRLLRILLKDRHFHFNPVKSNRSMPKEDSFVSTILDDREGRFRFIGLYAGDGLQVIDKKTGKTTYPDFKDQPNMTESNQKVMGLLQARDGTVWVLARHILYRFNPQTMRLEMPPQPPVYDAKIGTNYYNQMAEDAQGNIWISSGMYGVFRYNTRTGQTTHFMPDENKEGDIPTNVVGPMGSDSKGRVWFGSRDKTAYGYYLSDENRFVYLDEMGEVTQDLTSLRMNNYFTDSRGDIWACTEQGILHFDCLGDRPRMIRKYTTEDGLPSDYVPWGVEADDGNIWAQSAKNLIRLDINTSEITTFGKQDGVPDIITGMGKLGDGTLLFHSENGYHTFDADSLTPIRNEAPVVLTSFKVNDQEHYLGSQLVMSQPLIVPSDGRYFSLEFAALDLSNPELCRYEYKLEGFDNQWVKAGQRQLVNYTNIPAGHYSFKVKLEGRPDAEALSVPLTVQVAFYKTGWFWALVLAALAGISLTYFRKHQRQKQQVMELQSKAQLLEKEKATVMYESLKQQLNPHFLFNSLTSLGSLIHIDPKAAGDFLESLSKTYRYILKSNDVETVALSEELKFAETFVKLQKTRFEKGLQVDFGVGEEHFYRKIVPVTLQNLIENAIKHNILDEESPLVIAVFVENNYLVVRNNLQKKNFVETSNRQGLANLQSFYKYLSDREIDIQEDEQFFTIKIPLI